MPFYRANLRQDAWMTRSVVLEADSPQDAVKAAMDAWEGRRPDLKVGEGDASGFDHADCDLDDIETLTAEDFVADGGRGQDPMTWIVRRNGYPGTWPDGEPCFLYWNNDSGWGLRTTATVFSNTDRETFSLPKDGEWIGQFSGLFKATVEILIDVEDVGSACDCLAETLREVIQRNAPSSCILDWGYHPDHSIPVPATRDDITRILEV